jgi:hypothetical protein
MNVTIGGITALDRVELGPRLADHDIEFVEDETAQHGQGDMGVFTIGVPLTIAVAGVIRTWIKERAPLTKVKLEIDGKTVEIETNSPEELEKVSAFLDKHLK